MPAGRPQGRRNRTVVEKVLAEQRNPKRAKLKSVRGDAQLLNREAEEAVLRGRIQARIKAAFERAWVKMHTDPVTPLDALLWVMHVGIDRKDIPIIMQSAAIAAPFLHPRLTSAEVRVTNRTAKQMTDAELVAEIGLLQQRVQLSAMRLAAAGAQEALDGVAEPMEAETPDPPPEGLQRALEPEESR